MLPNPHARIFVALFSPARLPRFLAATATALALTLSWPVQAADQGPEDIVMAFNAAVTARNVDAIMDHLAEGSVQIQLRAAHPGMSDNPPLTADLRKNWQMVGTVLFKISKVYERTADITGATVDGEVATVWANTHTHTQRADMDEPVNRNFSEVYLLVLKNDQWLIAAIADNRQPGNLDVSGAE